MGGKRAAASDSARIGIIRSCLLHKLTIFKVYTIFYKSIEYTVLQYG